MNIVLVTGGFDPLHSGHIAYLNHARSLGDMLVVGLNSDEWLARKKGKPFMPLSERVSIVGSLHMVDDVIVFDDTDGSACDAIRVVKEKYPDSNITFANGGDRTADNIPEMIFDDVKFVFGVGGSNKANSSSWILREWKNPKTDRNWGYYRVLHSDGPSTKVKELTVNPNSQLSMQRHTNRSEFWQVTSGIAEVYLGVDSPRDLKLHVLKKHDTIFIPKECWHRLTNPHTEELRVVEIQYGSNCTEDDIERY